MKQGAPDASDAAHPSWPRSSTSSTSSSASRGIIGLLLFLPITAGQLGVYSKRVPKTLKFMFPEDETFDVGIDTRPPIDDRDYQVPFRFTGELNKLTVEEGPIRGTLAQILEFKWKTRD